MEDDEQLNNEEMEQEDDNGAMDYEQMNMRICGDLSKFDFIFHNSLYLVDKNKKLDEFFMSQNLDG